MKSTPPQDQKNKKGVEQKIDEIQLLLDRAFKDSHDPHLVRFYGGRMIKSNDDSDQPAPPVAT